MNKVKIIGWTANVLRHGITYLATVRADSQEEAFNKLRQVIPCIFDCQEVRPTTTIPDHVHAHLAEYEEYDFENQSQCI